MPKRVKGPRERKRERQERAYERSAGYTPENKIFVELAECPGCGGAEVFMLPGPLGLLRCDCGWQGLPVLQGPAGDLALTPEGPSEVVVDGTTSTLFMSFGVCTVYPYEGGLVAEHEHGLLIFAPTGHLIQAEGVFASANLLAPRPPPCACGSFWVDWLDSPDSDPLLLDAAERMGTKVVPHRCMGKVWLEIEGFGGRAAKCHRCGAVGVFPTLDPTRGSEMIQSRTQSVFISYGGPDEDFARQLVEFLREKQVKTWFFPDDALPGQKLHRVMHDGVHQHDRVLLICSKASLDRSGVKNEIERVLEREAREGGSSLLIPVTLDSHVFSDWAPDRPDLASQLRTRVIADFRQATSSMADFHVQCAKLLKALQA